MRTVVAFVHLLSTAGFAGGCSCLSVTLAGLLSEPPGDASRIMRALLPRMGAIMAPLLVVATLSGALSAWLALRTSSMEELGSMFALSTAAFGAIALVTVFVHLPINGALLATDPVPPANAPVLVGRWLNWHHVRTLLALAALCVLAWSRRHVFAPA